MESKRVLCLVCGSSSYDVASMHFFPSNIERSKVWQENMGIVFCGDSLKNQKICSRHFEAKWANDSRLSKYAVPTLHPATVENKELSSASVLEDVVETPEPNTLTQTTTPLNANMLSQDSATLRNRKCFVANCRSGFNNEIEKYRVLSTPRDQDTVLSNQDVICKRQLGPIVPYGRPQLAEGAVPTIVYKNSIDLKRTRCKVREKNKISDAVVDKEEIEKCLDTSIMSKKNEHCENYIRLDPLRIEEISEHNTKALFNNFYENFIPFELPQFCGVTTHEDNSEKYITFSKTFIYNKRPLVKHVLLDETLQLKFFFNTHEVKTEYTEKTMNLQHIKEALDEFMAAKICSGGPEDDMYCVRHTKIAKLDTITGKWRHNECSFVIKDGKGCCTNCSYLYQAFKHLKIDVEKPDRVVKMALEKKELKRQNRRLRHQLEMLKEQVKKIKK